MCVHHTDSKHEVIFNWVFFPFARAVHAGGALDSTLFHMATSWRFETFLSSVCSQGDVCQFAGTYAKRAAPNMLIIEL